MNSSILVIGSSNTDMVVKTTHLPAPGETILGGSFIMTAGGKGANQAVAAARLGAKVNFVCRTGNDIFGHQAKELFKKEGIDTTFVFEDTIEPSGVALINVDAKGENCIAVASGANARLSVEDIMLAAKCMEDAGIILMQLEIPLETVEYVAVVATSLGKKLILNPAPVCAISDELIKNVSILTPNETEAFMLTGIKVTDDTTAREAAKVLHDKGVATVIITLGAGGAFVFHENTTSLVKVPEVAALDTTAAGDVFNGALAVALSENMSMTDAVTFACKAAAISVTRMGAQASAPYRKELTG